MSLLDSSTLCGLICKYLTYKEWKRFCSTLKTPSLTCKYLTYKEWKQINELVDNFLGVISKYLTYKEWKQNC